MTKSHTVPPLFSTRRSPNHPRLPLAQSPSPVAVPLAHSRPRLPLAQSPSPVDRPQSPSSAARSVTLACCSPTVAYSPLFCTRRPNCCRIRKVAQHRQVWAPYARIEEY
ncbi:hypothetical protein Cni_G06995 [Canna indica]|uniref:Uncharacterized protein n=1 Tax=Canna indica TaxID=4628 RepID=A0AAQ3K2X4_9LILI|nr:hypothetical protein Cni_G06995 [Canna indica]